METGLPAKDRGFVPRSRRRSRPGSRLAIAVAAILVAAAVGPWLASASTTESPPPPAPPASAEAAPAPGSSPADLETYGDADATCREWSNGCQVCRRQPGSDWSCSTAGIACVPEPVTCRSR